MKNNNKVFSVDAETNGLYGQAFAIAAVVYENGAKIAEFLARCPITGAIDQFVKENVIPQMEEVRITHRDYVSMLHDFICFYKKHKQDADIIGHMVCPVEARLFIDAQAFGLMGTFEGPFPFIDISAYDDINTSVDAYNKEHDVSVSVSSCAKGTHNPMYDADAAVAAYSHLKRNK